MAEPPVAAAVFYATLTDIRGPVTTQARQAWAEVTPNFLSESWARTAPALVPRLAAAQVEAASAGLAYGTFALAEQGLWVAPDAWVDPAAFGGGWSSSGARLEETLQTPIIRAKQAIADGAAVAEALAVGWRALAGIVRMQVADAGRVAAGADIAAREGVGYVRMLNPPSCDRCTVLAGRFYRWNAGFRRHPRCNCVHAPSAQKSTDAARREGLVDDPYAYFRGLSEAEQDKVFGRFQAQAIRDGADIYQVINSRRGRRGAFTTEGTGRRGHAARLLRRGQRRMTPETIYRLNPNRLDALKALADQGYILTGGQVPGGSLRGRVEGFGQMGRGGTRKAATEAILQARRTGARDPTNRYTMTAAERRLYDAEQNYRMVLQGRSPYTSPGFGNTPDPHGLRLNRVGASTRPPTPDEAARAETAYRQALAAAGPGAAARGPVSAGGGGRVPPPPRTGAAGLGDDDTPEPRPAEQWGGDAPRVAVERDRLQVMWFGSTRSRGGHSPDSAQPGKTKVTGTWTFEQYVAAVQATVDAPQFAARFRDGRVAVRTREAGGVIWAVVSDPGTGTEHAIRHAYPVNGAGVVRNPARGSAGDPEPIPYDRAALGLQFWSERFGGR